MHKIYNLDGEITSLAVANSFILVLNKMAKQWGDSLTPFCIFGSVKQRQAGVVDLRRYMGLLNKEDKLVNEVVKQWGGELQSQGVDVDIDDSGVKKLLFFDYLLHASACYVEVPKYAKINGMPTHTYDKFIATSNIGVIAEWMGITKEEAQEKYGSKLLTTQTGYDVDELKYVKLNKSKTKGNTVTSPRKFVNGAKMTCIPLFMQSAFVQGLKRGLESQILEFTFIKDNNTERVLTSTISREIMGTYYSDKQFVDGCLYGVDIDTLVQQGLRVSHTYNRGYIKIPELGASVYDASGLRSLNTCRITSIKPVKEVDRTFIEVDLESVVLEFHKHLSSIYNRSPECTRDIYMEFVVPNLENFDSMTIVDKGDAWFYSELDTYVAKMNVLLSSTFLRKLHLYMVAHPDLFRGYTGKKAKRDDTPIDVGVLFAGLDHLGEVTV